MQTITILSALLTPLIAVTTTYIAVQQYRRDRHKFNLERYERRIEVYRAVSEFLRKVPPNDLLHPNDDYFDKAFDDLMSGIAEADFVYPEELLPFWKDLRDAAIKACFLLERSTVRGENPDWDETKDWLKKANRSVVDRFRPYLRLDD